MPHELRALVYRRIFYTCVRERLIHHQISTELYRKCDRKSQTKQINETIEKPNEKRYAKRYDVGDDDVIVNKIIDATNIQLSPPPTTLAISIYIYVYAKHIDARVCMNEFITFFCFFFTFHGTHLLQSRTYSVNVSILLVSKYSRRTTPPIDHTDRFISLTTLSFVSDKKFCEILKFSHFQFCFYFLFFFAVIICQLY